MLRPLLLPLLVLFGCREPFHGIEDTGDALAKPATRAASVLEEAAAPVPLWPPAPSSVALPPGRAIVRDCYGRDPEIGRSRKGSAAPASPAPLTSVAESAAGNEAARIPEAAWDASVLDEAAAPAERGVVEKDEARFVEPVRPPPARPGGPALEWGGTIHLSNDDSMSLASAQRLLWAVKNHQPYTVAEVRPHELLNYFSFDTEPVSEGRMFSVLASAERTGPDAMSLALAVRGANPPRQPLDLTVVVDRSGSMSAEGRMAYVKRGLDVMSESLRHGDRVNVVLFDDRVCTPLEDYVVGRDDPALLDRAISDLRPRGATNLDLGLKEGYALAHRYAPDTRGQRNERVLLLTDAWLNTGDVRPDVVTEVGRALDAHDIRLTGIGVGRRFNDTVLDMLTEKGKGAYVYLGSEAVVDRVFGLGFEALTRTIAHDVRFALELPDSLAMLRFYGEESSRRAEDVQPIHYYAGTTQLFLQDVRVNPATLKPRDRVRLRITWTDALDARPREQVVATTVGWMLEADPHNVQKARALMAWSDDMLVADAMDRSGCGAPLDTWRDRLEGLGEDSEIAYLNGLVEDRCQVRIALPGPREPAGVAYKVKLDTDMPIAEVVLECRGVRQARTLTAGESVVTFQVPPGTCRMLLEGPVPLSTQVTVPATGGQTRCMLRGGRLSCS
ncbi:MAG: VWA domain-containing protein [Deltaproteobacteria bacterium]|nr:VWA domain-containing protein [Deltaproteobacteria bacterium]